MDELIEQYESGPSTQPAPSSMQHLEMTKRNKAREFSQNLLESMTGISTTNNNNNERSSKKRSFDGQIEGPNAKEMRIADKEIKEEEEDDEENLIMANAPRIKSYLIVQEKNCNHEVIIPPDVEYSPLVTRTVVPAKTYEFKLDMFQKQAIKCLDNQQSVLVSAHTSAGKTVVALYAIALALRDKQRVIYTSPIKALSNQKYRELSEEFDDVGLVTGDVTLNPNASCVVMTTEILRSMLYRGTEIMREVGWVIFDEIHYMRDKERGVVWEETIILLPDTTHYVFLSATIPNAKQFAEWICYLHRQPCHVVYTDNRPVPLQHLIYSAGADGLYEVVDIKGNFKQENFTKAMSYLAESQPTGGEVRQLNHRRSDHAQAINKSVVKIIRTIKEHDMLPCIIFSFSRKECEVYAKEVKDMDFNSEDDKKAIRMIFDNAIDLLSEEDKKLPQIRNVLPYLLRGIGIHHSGQLPIMKEVVEILFGEGLIKTLFATETFAMGVNMPAKTVLFTSARKFDGTTNRWISSGEYIQMSGRAGRRGKDEKGLVILMLDQQMSADTAMQLIKGTSDPLNSQFRLTYNMVLNLLRVPDINPEFMLEKSFHQWQNYCSLPKLLQTLNEKRMEMKNFQVDHEIELKNYHQMVERIEAIKKSIKSLVLKPSKVVPFFQPGRMMKIKHFDKDFGWGVLINYKKIPNPLNPLSPDLIYVLDMAVMISRESERNLPNLNMIKPLQLRERGVIAILPFTFECIDAVSTIRLKVPQELKSKEAKEVLAKTLEETKKRFVNLIPELDPIEHMHITDQQLKTELTQMSDLETRKRDYALTRRQDFGELYRAYLRKLELIDAYKMAKQAYDNGQKLLQLEELRCRKRVLRRLGYATDDDTITEKGRVACELSSADELLLTEMLFTGSFSELSAASAAALLSCVVFEERAPTGKLGDELSGYLRKMQSIAKKIAAISKECKLEIDEEKYVDQFSAGMMDVVNRWCTGATFAEIMDSTQLFEGSIIRCMRRLEELLQEMMNAAKSLGDQTLLEKFEVARTLLKRDIVFSASLYL